MKINLLQIAAAAMVMVGCAPAPEPITVNYKYPIAVLPVSIAKVKSISLTLSKKSACNESDLFDKYQGKIVDGVQIDGFQNILIEDHQKPPTMVGQDGIHECKIFALGVQYNLDGATSKAKVP